MKILKLYIILLLIFSCIGTIQAKKKVEANKPISGPIKSTRALTATCSACPSFTCPNPTGSSGCTGPGCSGPCSPTTTANFCCLNVVGNETIRGFLTVNNETISGNLNIGLNADVKDNLEVDGFVDLKGNACVEQNLNVGCQMAVTGFEVVLGTLTANSGATINGNLVETGNETINGTLMITGDESIGQMLTVNGQGSFAGKLFASGNSATGATGPSLIVSNGEIINNGGLIILNLGCSGITGITGITGVTGITGCTGANITGDVCITGDETLHGNLIVIDQLVVDGNALFNNVTVGTTGPTGSTGANSTFTTNGNALLYDGLIIASGDEIINAGNLTIVTGPLSVGGSSQFMGQVTANNGAIISRGLTVNGGESILLGSLDVSTGSAIVTGQVMVNGPITSLTGRSSFSDLTLTDTRNSLCPSGPGTLTVNGGVGIAQDLWVGGCQYFAEVAREGGIPSCFDYYEEACFATAFTWGGQPVVPSANVLVYIVRVGSIVNLLIPPLIIHNPGAHIDDITSSTPLPIRFRPTQSARGAASTVIYNTGTSATPTLVGQLGEWDVSPAGIITIGLPGDALGPQLIASTDIVEADADTLTYNLLGCNNRHCQRPCP